jgi:hypothetical protein
MRLVAMPAYADILVISGTQDLLDGSTFRTRERLDPRNKRQNPVGDVVGSLELAFAIVITPAKGRDLPVTFIGPN